jgi:chromosome segregation ATPase
MQLQLAPTLKVNMTEAMINQNQQAQAFSPFGKRNANKDRIEQEEAELKQLSEDKNNQQESQDGEDSSLSGEEKSFKKRYGDLRRHSQQQQTTLQKQIDELRSQLQQSTEKQIKLPKSEEELNEWVKTYPDVAKIVETIAIKKAKEQTQALDERFKQLDERENQTAKDKAEAELTRLHPDFDVIRDDDDFHNWVEEQPKWVQDALYDNDSDAKAAARAIDLYKADKGIKTKKVTSDKGAAESVNTRGSRSAPTGESKDGVFYESQVNKMSTFEYEKNQEAIAKALQSGKFVYDISGSAR